MKSDAATSGVDEVGVLITSTTSAITNASAPMVVPETLGDDVWTTSVAHARHVSWQSCRTVVEEQRPLSLLLSHFFVAS